MTLHDTQGLAPITHTIYCQKIYTMDIKYRCNGRLSVRPRSIYGGRL